MQAQLIKWIAIAVLAVAGVALGLWGWEHFTNGLRAQGASVVQAKWDTANAQAASELADRTRKALALDNRRATDDAIRQARLEALDQQVTDYAKSTNDRAARGEPVCGLDADGVRLWNRTGIDAGYVPAAPGASDSGVSRPQVPATDGTPGRSGGGLQGNGSSPVVQPKPPS